MGCMGHIWIRLYFHLFGASVKVLSHPGCWLSCLLRSFGINFRKKIFLGIVALILFFKDNFGVFISGEGHKTFCVVQLETSILFVCSPGIALLTHSEALCNRCRRKHFWNVTAFLQKVGRVTSCEIRARPEEVGERRRVRHFGFVQTTFVLLIYLFPFSTKASNKNKKSSGTEDHNVRGTWSQFKKKKKENCLFSFKRKQIAEIVNILCCNNHV